MVGRPHRQAGDERGERRARRAAPRPTRSWRAVLPPRHPCHRSRPFSGGSRRRAGARAPCRRAGAPRARPASTVHDGSTIAPSIRTSSVSWRPLCRSRTISLDPADRAERARARPSGAGASRAAPRRCPRGGRAPPREQDDVVADALDVGDHVRGDHDRRRVSATPSISSCRNSRPASGSSRANGSSSRSSAGRLPSASASARRARSPAESADDSVAEPRAASGTRARSRRPSRGFVAPRELDRVARR